MGAAAVRRDYGIQVQACGRDADIVHTSVVYFIARTAPNVMSPRRWTIKPMTGRPTFP